MKEMTSKPHGLSVAYRTARALAYDELAAALDKVIVDSETVIVKSKEENDVVTNELHAVVKGARVIRWPDGMNRKEEWMDGAPVGDRAPGPPLLRRKRITKPILEQVIDKKAGYSPPAYEPPKEKVKKAVAVVEKKPYTGVIVVSSGLGTRPALVPRVVTSEGKEVYGPSVADRVKTLKIGMVGYAGAKLRPSPTSGRATTRWSSRQAP